MATQNYISLLALADHLGLPLAWVKSETQAGRLPCLRVGRRLMFNAAAVERSLAERAAPGHTSAITTDPVEGAGQ